MDLKKNPLILLVDDNSDLLESFSHILVENNYKVKKGYNGDQALRILTESEQKPDLIISDIKMPEMNGYQFFQKISNHPQFNQIPFVFLTGLSSNEEIRLGKLLGPDDYLTKPITEQNLLATIEGKIKRRNQISEINNQLNKKIRKDIINSQYEDDESNSEDLWLLFVIWDAKIGAKLQKYLPKDEEKKERFIQLGAQSFKAIYAIYGTQIKVHSAEDVLIRLKNVGKDAYIYFGVLENQNSIQMKESPYMLSVIADSISYFDKVQIRKLITEEQYKISIDKEWDMNELYYKIKKHFNNHVPNKI
ncbi:MAG: response regulator [Candidatus Lokiarchaeota archaeon]|nr:response regulator [Candidatus Lokiarchaeota archaeon]MBD3199194.1 response regulator [Candidatus Lokiarchaeota archaeon]